MAKPSLVSLLGGLVLFCGAAGMTMTILRKPMPPGLTAPVALDLGDQEFGTVAVGRFRITNDGGQPLNLGPFATSCSCAGLEIERTTPDGIVWNKVSTLTIEPQCSVNLAVRVAVGGKVGQNQDLTIVGGTNVPSTPSWQLSVTIPRITGGIHCQPSAVVFDSMSVPFQKTERIIVYANGDPNRKITGVRAWPSDRFAASVVPVKADIPPHPTAGEAIGIIEVELQQNQPGLVWGRLAIAINGQEPRDHEHIMITGEVPETTSQGSQP
jgi:hypothetical protein